MFSSGPIVVLDGSPAHWKQAYPKAAQDRASVTAAAPPLRDSAPSQELDRSKSDGPLNFVSLAHLGPEGIWYHFVAFEGLIMRD